MEKKLKITTKMRDEYKKISEAETRAKQELQTAYDSLLKKYETLEEKHKEKQNLTEMKLRQQNVILKDQVSRLQQELVEITESRNKAKSDYKVLLDLLSSRRF